LLGILTELKVECKSSLANDLQQRNRVDFKPLASEDECMYKKKINYENTYGHELQCFLLVELSIHEHAS
jgi:hypothetical protein